MPYKLIKNLNNEYLISRGNQQFARSMSNPDYLMFLEQIANNTDNVEGADVSEPSYSQLRSAAYPPLVQQLDMQYWDKINGTTLWADAIESVKQRYPKTLTGGKTIEPVPSWVNEDVNAFVLKNKLEEYVWAINRLAKYKPEEGQEEEKQEVVVRTERNPTTNELIEIKELVVVKSKIKPVELTVQSSVFDENGNPKTVTIENPIITQDKAERLRAQEVIDNASIEIISAYQNL